MSRLVQEFRVQLDELERVRQSVLAFSQSQDPLGEEFTHDVLAAVTEVFVNFVKHSNLKAEDFIELQIEFTEEALVIIFKDFGEPFEIAKVEDPDLDALHESGYGLFIVKSLMDTLEYFPKTSDKAYNTTRLTKGYHHGER